MAEKKFRSWVGFREEEDRAPIANPVDRIRELESQLADLRSRRDITGLSREEFEILATETAMSMIKSAQAREAKANALIEFSKSEGVSLHQTIAIGDGANDLGMIEIAGLGIAFNAKPKVKAAADASINTPYLDSVLYLMGITREEVESN